MKDSLSNLLLSKGFIVLHTKNINQNACIVTYKHLEFEGKWDIEVATPEFGKQASLG